MRRFNKLIVNTFIVFFCVMSFNFIPIREVVPKTIVNESPIIAKTVSQLSPLEVHALGLDNVLTFVLTGVGDILLAPEIATVLTIVLTAGVVFTTGYAAYQFCKYVVGKLQGYFDANGSLILTEAVKLIIDTCIADDLPSTPHAQDTTINYDSDSQSGDVKYVGTGSSTTYPGIPAPLETGYTYMPNLTFYTDELLAGTSVSLTVGSYEYAHEKTFPNSVLTFKASNRGYYKIRVGINCAKSNYNTSIRPDIEVNYSSTKDGTYSYVSDIVDQNNNLWLDNPISYVESLLNTSIPLHQSASQSISIPYTGQEATGYSQTKYPTTGSVVNPAKNPSIPATAPVNTGAIANEGSISAPTTGSDTGTGTINIPILSDIYKALKGIWDWLLDILQRIYGAIISIPSAIATAVGSLSLDWSLPNTAYIDFSPLEVDVSSKFPFSIPFDLINMFKGFSAPSKAPKWEATFPNVAGLGEQKLTIDWDKTELNKIANITRYFTLIAFVVGLILITKELI